MGHEQLHNQQYSCLLITAWCRWYTALAASVEEFQALKRKLFQEYQARKAQKALEEKGEEVGTQAPKLLMKRV
jgi:hypothetical protein